MKDSGHTPASFYDRIVPVYDIFASHNIKPYRKILRRLEIGPGHSALEVGCGTGNLTIPLAAVMRKVVSIDFAPRMLERASRKVAARGISNVTFRQENAFALTPEVYGTHDYVFTAFLLHVFPAVDRPLLLSTVARLAVKRVVVIDYGPGRYRLRYAVIEWLEKSHYKEFVHSDLPAQARVAGLELLRFFEEGDFGVWEFKCASGRSK